LVVPVLAATWNGRFNKRVASEHPGARLVVGKDGRHQEGMLGADDLFALGGWYSYTTLP
jgi:hypothetical protein